jgi:hypothetical protein
MANVVKIVKGISKGAAKVKKQVAANKIDRAEQMLKLNKDIKTKKDAEIWATHPGAASFKSNQRLVKKGKWSSPKQIARYQRQEAKQEIKANARGLKAANKPVSKNNRNMGGPTLKGILKNETPARPNRERGGSLATLRRQGKTTPTSPAKRSSLKGKLGKNNG